MAKQICGLADVRACERAALQKRRLGSVWSGSERERARGGEPPAKPTKTFGRRRRLRSETFELLEAQGALAAVKRPENPDRVAIWQKDCPKDKNALGRQKWPESAARVVIWHSAFVRGLKRSTEAKISPKTRPRLRIALFLLVGPRTAVKWRKWRRRASLPCERAILRLLR